MDEALRISGIGIFIVFFALVFISIILSIIGYFFTKKTKVKANSISVSNKETETELIKDTEGIDPEIIAVITAAISLSYGPCTRINSISTVHRESQYGIQGRMNIMGSHKLK